MLHWYVQAKFRVNQHCKVLCRIASLNKAQEKAFKSRISDEYRVNMCVGEGTQSSSPTMEGGIETGRCCMLPPSCMYSWQYCG